MYRSFQRMTSIVLLSMTASHAMAQPAPQRQLPTMPTVTAPIVAEGVNPETKRVAMLAWDLFLNAWSTGEWQPFFDMTTDDFQFYFPAGEHAGLHEGADGKRMLIEWGNYHKQAGNRIRSVTLNVTIGGNSAVFETAAASIPEGFYRNYEAIVFEVRGDRISALREYWNVLSPGADSSGN